MCEQRVIAKLMLAMIRAGQSNEATLSQINMRCSSRVAAHAAVSEIRVLYRLYQGLARRLRI